MSFKKNKMLSKYVCLFVIIINMLLFAFVLPVVYYLSFRILCPPSETVTADPYIDIQPECI